MNRESVLVALIIASSPGVYETLKQGSTNVLENLKQKTEANSGVPSTVVGEEDDEFSAKEKRKRGDPSKIKT